MGRCDPQPKEVNFTLSNTVLEKSRVRALEDISPVAAKEAFKPVPVRCGAGTFSKVAFVARQWIDLQLLTCVRFLRPRMARLQGKVLDVGCGEMPFRPFLSHEVHYQGLDVAESVSFGMRNHPDIVLFDGVNIPFPDNSWDGILCTEVLEHAVEPELLIAEMLRVLRPGGTLLLTVPFAARVHHAPHDYRRFTSFCLHRMLADFESVEILHRGNDYAVIANKMIVLNARLLTGGNWMSRVFAMPIAVVALVPLAALAVFVAHISMFLDLGSKDDPLGYGCSAKKRER
jgi:SAM-dependent methyltransferase